MRQLQTDRPSRSERRKRIVEAATQLFARQGYVATTVDQIAAAADVSKPMLYRDFESKQELCVALLERYRDELAAVPLGVFDPDAPDPAEHRLLMIAAWLEHAVAHPDATRLLFIPILGDLDVQQTQRQLHDLQRATQIALLREFAPDILEVEAEAMGELVRSGLGAMAVWSIEHPEVPRGVPAGLLARMIDGLIGARSGEGQGGS